MTTILAFIIVLGVIVMVHELGHFFAARSVGVRVDRFSIGFPPRLMTITSVPNGFEIKLFFYIKDLDGKISRPVSYQSVSLEFSQFSLPVFYLFQMY